MVESRKKVGAQEEEEMMKVKREGKLHRRVRARGRQPQGKRRGPIGGGESERKKKPKSSRGLSCTVAEEASQTTYNKLFQMYFYLLLDFLLGDSWALV